MVRKAFFALVLLIGAVYALATIHPAATATPISQVASTPSLPSCTYEDGSGQGLCYWDADTQGNRKGTDAVSGECAVGSTGINTHEASTWCMRLWGKGHVKQVVSDDGATDEWYGPDMVRDCIDLEMEAMQDNDIRESLNEEGWNVTECFKAYLT